MNETIAKLLFPDGQVQQGGGGTIEVNNLSKNTIPKNCEILSSKKANDRTYYMVRCGEYFVQLRVCDAMVGSGYDEFAVIHRLTTDKELAYHAIDTMKYL